MSHRHGNHIYILPNQWVLVLLFHLFNEAHLNKKKEKEERKRPKKENKMSLWALGLFVEELFYGSALA